MEFSADESGDSVMLTEPVMKRNDSNALWILGTGYQYASFSGMSFALKPSEISMSLSVVMISASVQSSAVYVSFATSSSCMICKQYFLHMKL
jgi:hypothetical protein